MRDLELPAILDITLLHFLPVGHRTAVALLELLLDLLLQVFVVAEPLSFLLDDELAHLWDMVL